MKVLFVSDFSLRHNYGGAQRSNDVIINHGRSLGHEVVEFNIDSPPELLLDKYDVVVSSNLQFFSERRADVLGYIIQHSNHVRLEHDMNTYLPSGVRNKLFASSKVNFFLSQYHVDSFKEEYGDHFDNVEIVYDPIDAALFNNQSVERYLDVVYCGFVHQLKGSFNLKNFAVANPDRQIDIWGWADRQEDLEVFDGLSNVKFHGRVTHEDTAGIFNRARYIFHQPVVREPFCRMVAEALLCGAKPLCNDRIGSLKEFEKINDERAFALCCTNAASYFWGNVDTYINENLIGIK